MTEISELSDNCTVTWSGVVAQTLHQGLQWWVWATSRLKANTERAFLSK